MRIGILILLLVFAIMNCDEEPKDKPSDSGDSQTETTQEETEESKEKEEDSSSTSENKDNNNSKEKTSSTNNGNQANNGSSGNDTDSSNTSSSSSNNNNSSTTNESNNSNSDDSNTLTAHHLKFTTQPSSSVIAGAELATLPVIEVQSSDNAKVTSSTLNITLAAFTDSACQNAASGTLSAATNPLAASNGVASFSGVNYTKAESIYLKASATGVTSDCSLVVTVSPAADNKLSFTTEPSSTATTDTNFSTQPVVKIYDQYNNLTSSTAAVSLAAFSSSNCTGAVAGTLTASSPSTSSGTATFSGVQHDTAETIYLKATSGSLTADCSTAVAVSAPAAFAISVDDNLDNGSGTPNTEFSSCGGGSNKSPAISWSNKPAGTSQFVLFMIDTWNSGSNTFLHWLIKFPGDTASLPQNIGNDENPAAVTGATQYDNDFPTKGWGGPAPPTNNHNYTFTLYALQSSFTGTIPDNLSDFEDDLGTQGISYSKDDQTFVLNACP